MVHIVLNVSISHKIIHFIKGFFIYLQKKKYLYNITRLNITAYIKNIKKNTYITKNIEEVPLKI